MKKYLSTLLIALCMAVILTGCPSFPSGGGTAGRLDRRSTAAQSDDKVMEVKILDEAMNYLNNHSSNKHFKPTIFVISYNRQILLLGLVASESDKNQVGRVARAQPAAQNVYNYIDVSSESHTSRPRIYDYNILLNVRGVSPTYTKVVTYDRIAYVMGILTPEEQQSATNKISAVDSVEKVIPLYQTFNPATANQGTKSTNS
nr:BON domain-containing protein [Snodgrassella alvi]